MTFTKAQCRQFHANLAKSIRLYLRQQHTPKSERIKVAVTQQAVYGWPMVLISKPGKINIYLMLSENETEITVTLSHYRTNISLLTEYSINLIAPGMLAKINNIIDNVHDSHCVKFVDDIHDTCTYPEPK